MNLKKEIYFRYIRNNMIFSVQAKNNTDCNKRNELKPEENFLLQWHFNNYLTPAARFFIPMNLFISKR